jgi:hypothetical protein
MEIVKLPFSLRAGPLALCLFFSMLCPPQLLARSNNAPQPFDPDYVSALAASNRFLHAWQTQDHETGVVMLTDVAKRHTSVDHLETFFSSEPAAQPAFEINRGKKLKAGRYAFPVVLFDVVSGARQSRHSRIIVVRTGKDDWAIDKLP